MPVACTVTPAKQFADGEKWTRTLLNLLGVPSVTIADGLITATQLSSAVNALLAALGNAIVANVAKSADFTVLTSDRAKLFDVTTGGSNVTATLPSAVTAGAGFYVWLRKADTGAGKVLTSPAASPDAIGLGKQAQTVMLESDGTNWITPIMTGFRFDANGNLFSRSAFIGIGGSVATNPAVKANGTTFGVRLGDDSADAPMSASEGLFSARVSNNGDFPIPASDVDWSKSNSFYKTLAANTTFTFSNPKDGQSIEIELLQDGTGGRTVTWPAGIKWYGGAPTMTPTASKRDTFALKQVNGTISGSYRQNV